MQRKSMTAKQLQVIKLLLTCPSRASATKAAGVSPTTLYRWFENPDFVSEYERAASKYLDENICQLQANTNRALETLVEVMVDKNAAATARLSAARTIYEFAFRAKDLAVAARIDELERLIKNGGEVFIDYEDT